jgi:putative N6-adenine-specific DNA methylase
VSSNATSSQGKILNGFAVCPAGLEETLEQELALMPGFQEIKKGRGGVRFAASPDSIAHANLWARVPTRLLIEVGTGSVRKQDDIHAIALRVLWEQWFTFRQTLRIDLAVGREPKLEKPLARNFATLLIKDGICDRFRKARGERPSIDTTHPDIRVWAYLDQNELTLYIDTSGEPLFKRGWRQSKGEAPLRENLAAALVMMSQWDGKTPLLDPFCGSGTLLIEALQCALRLPPGYVPSAPREFAAERFHANSPMGQVNWQALRAKAKQDIERVEKEFSSGGAAIRLPKINGSDRDSRMIRVAKENAERALPLPIASAIEWKVCAFEEVTPNAGHGLLIANPPYGKRLEKRMGPADTPMEAENAGSAAEQVDFSFERGIAETLKKKFAGWSAWLLTDDLKLESHMRLKASRRIPVFNGDIECRWMRFDMVAGSMRDPGKAASSAK